MSNTNIIREKNIDLFSGNFFSCWRARSSLVEKAITVKGEAISLSGGYALVEFHPEGRLSFNHKKITESLVFMIHGYLDILEAIDQGRFQPALIFIGRANLHMALIAPRMGFVITDECRTADGDINKGLEYYTVVGKLEDIRRNVEELRQSGTYERLQERANKLTGVALWPQLIAGGI